MNDDTGSYIIRTRFTTSRGLGRAPPDSWRIHPRTTFSIRSICSLPDPILVEKVDAIVLASPIIAMPTWMLILFWTMPGALPFSPST